jgi:hypothetical protein
VALGNWHNRGNLDAFEAGDGEPVPMTEEIALDDFHGLIDLLLIAARALDEPDPTEALMRDRYERSQMYLRRGSVRPEKSDGRS